MADWRRVAAVYGQTNLHKSRIAASVATIQDMDRQSEGRWAVSSSWGKDSSALAALALAVIGRRLRVFHLKSPYALPGWEPVARWFHQRCEVIERPYAKSLPEYLEWLRTAGLGFEREAKGQGAAAKNNEAMRWAAAVGLRGIALGIRAEESKRRSFVRAGPYIRRDRMMICNPILRWSAADVWAYIAKRELPYHPMYDQETHGYTRESIRNAGWLTTIDPGRIPWLRTHYRKHYRMLEEKFPHVRAL